MYNHSRTIELDCYGWSGNRTDECTIKCQHNQAAGVPSIRSFISLSLAPHEVYTKWAIQVVLLWLYNPYNTSPLEHKRNLWPLKIFYITLHFFHFQRPAVGNFLIELYLWNEIARYILRNGKTQINSNICWHTCTVRLHTSITQGEGFWWIFVRILVNKSTKTVCLLIRLRTWREKPSGAHRVWAN